MPRVVIGFVSVLLAAVITAGCTTLQVVYRDGCFFLSGIPSEVRAIRVTLRTTSAYGIETNEIFRPVGEDGTTTPICVGAMFRRRYEPGEIQVTTYDGSGKRNGGSTNTREVQIDGTGAEQEIGYGAFR